MSVTIRFMERIASEAHKDQKYGDKPYMFHVKQVHDFCLKMIDKNQQIFDVGLQEQMLTVALGHDLVEDTPWTLEELAQCGFDKHIVSSIDCITKRENESREDYLSRCMTDVVSLLVKYADSRCNLHASIQSKSRKRVMKYSMQQEQLLMKIFIHYPNFKLVNFDD